MRCRGKVPCICRRATSPKDRSVRHIAIPAATQILTLRSRGSRHTAPACCQHSAHGGMISLISNERREPSPAHFQLTHRTPSTSSLPSPHNCPPSTSSHRTSVSRNLAATFHRRHSACQRRLLGSISRGEPASPVSVAHGACNMRARGGCAWALEGEEAPSLAFAPLLDPG